jgi:hypothetical protein
LDSYGLKYIFCHPRVVSAFSAVYRRVWLDAIVWLALLSLSASRVRELVAISDKDMAGIKLYEWSRVRPVPNDAVSLPRLEMYLFLPGRVMVLVCQYITLGRGSAVLEVRCRLRRLGTPWYKVSKLQVTALLE